jgi:hypothetical protein
MVVGVVGMVGVEGVVVVVGVEGVEGCGKGEGGRRSLSETVWASVLNPKPL